MKKVLSLILVIAMVFSLCAITASAADEAALTIYTQAGENGTPVLAKSYTAAELKALEETATAGYLYYKGDSWTAVAVTEYVTIDALFADAGVSFEAGNSLQFICGDGVYTKSFPTYEDIAAGKYYIDETGATEVPAAIAIAWGQGTLDGTTLDILATESKDTGNLRFVYGISEEQYAATNAAGNRYPSGVGSITVIQEPALTVYTQRGENGEPVAAASYSAAQLKAMAENKTAGYQYYKGDVWTAVAATEYVTLDALFADAGVSFEAGNSLQFTCTDGVYTKSFPTYEDIAAGKYYIDETGATEVPVALAISWEQGSLDGTTLADLAAASKDSGSLRFVYGISEEQYAATNAAGMRYPSGVVSVTVITDGFSDVTTSAQWFYEPVYAAYEAGLIEGMGDGTFGADATLTWAQTVAFAVRAHQKMAGTAVYGAADQTGDNWYDVYVTYALANGIITEKAAEPTAMITRADAAVIFANAMGAKAGTGEVFTDVAATDAFSGAVYALYNAGIVNGMGDGTFGAEGSFTRGHAAAIVYRMIDETARLEVK